MSFPTSSIYSTYQSEGIFPGSEKKSMSLIHISSEESTLRLTSSVYLDQSTAETIDIIVPAHSECRYFFFPENGYQKRNFYIESGAHIDVRGLIIWTDIVSQLSFIVEWERIIAHMDLLAFAKADSKIQIEWTAQVKSWSSQIDVRVDQTNILLGNNAKVRGMPVLQVATDDVIGGHSCKIHRISGESMFYLESHGISPENAETMLIQSEIWKRLAIIKESEESIEICSRVFESIVHQKSSIIQS